MVLNENKQKQFKKREITVFAHRGLSAKYPENTLLAYEKAIEVGADYVEIDVRITKDDKMIIYHNNDLYSLIGKKKKIKKVKFDKLRCLDLGMGQRMPTLEEVFELCKDKIGVQLDVKDDGLIERILEVVDQYDMASQVFLSDFNHKEIGILKNLRPEITGGIIVPNNDISKLSMEEYNELFISEAKKYSADAIHPQFKYVNKELIKMGHSEGIMVNAWTADLPNIWVDLINLGVDGIFTNNCELLIDFLEHKDEDDDSD
ncbi:MAG: glycerophosphodiester phosphodiesterase [Promethearchaeota archaeon]